MPGKICGRGFQVLLQNLICFSTQVNPTNGTILFARRINFPKKSSNYKRSVLLVSIFLLKMMSDVFNFVNDTVQSLSIVFRTTITVSF